MIGKEITDTLMEIGGLRTLLPEKLINPTRVALDNPNGYEPEKLAAYLHAAAQTGSRDVERFKKEWHSEDVRQLWNTVSTAELHQGSDAWVMDYSSLLQTGGPHEEHHEVANGIGSQPEQPSRGNTLEVITNFKTGHPDLTVEVIDESTGLPVNITIAQLKFQVDQSNDGSGFKVIGRPNTEASALRNNILENISSNSALKNLLVRCLIPLTRLRLTKNRNLLPHILT